MGVFLCRFIGRVLTSQIEIQLGRPVCESLRVVDACLDGAVNKKNNLIIGVRQFADDIVSVRICPGDFLEAAAVFSLNMNFGTCDRLCLRVLHITLQGGRTDRRSPGGYARNEQHYKTDLERFGDHRGDDNKSSDRTVQVAPDHVRRSCVTRERNLSVGRLGLRFSVFVSPTRCLGCSDVRPCLTTSPCHHSRLPSSRRDGSRFAWAPKRNVCPQRTVWPLILLQSRS